MAHRSSDVSFLMNSGTYSGETYKFTLAEQNGQKMWAVNRVFQPSPSMRKEQLNIGISLKENIPLSGAKELKISSTLQEQLEIVADESTYITMMGLDGVSRDVRVDSTGFTVETIMDEKGRPAEFVAMVKLWSMYK